MSKFFSRFSKRKLVPIVSVLLIVAIGTPLVTRQFWVYDADSSKFDAVNFSGNGALTEISKDDLVKSKKSAQLVLNVLKDQPSTNDPDVLSKWFLNIIANEAINQEITDTGELVISPNISYLAGMRYLSQFKTHLLTLSDGADKSTQEVLNSLTDEIDKSMKLLGTKKPAADEQQGVFVKAEFLRISDLIQAKLGNINKGNVKDIATEASIQLKAFPADDQKYINAISLYTNMNQAMAEMSDISQQIIQLCQSLHAQFIFTDGSTETVSQIFDNTPSGFLEKAKAAETRSVTDTGLQNIQVTVKPDVFKDWLSKSKVVLAKDIPLADKKNEIAALAYDTFKLDLRVPDKNAFLNANGSAFTALATKDEKFAWSVLSNNIQFASIWDGYSTYASTDSLYWRQIATAVQNNDLAAVNNLLDQAGIAKESILQFNDKTTNSYLDAQRALVAPPAPSTTTSTQTTPAATATTATANLTSLTSSTLSSDSLAAAEESMKLVNLSGLIADIKKQNTYKEDFEAMGSKEIQATKDAVASFLHNNLTDSYFGKVYLPYLRNVNDIAISKVYASKNAFCVEHANDPYFSAIKSECESVKVLAETYSAKVTGTQPLTTNELKGSLSMDPRTGHMVYNTTVVYIDQGGKPNIAGSMTFDPINNQVSGNLTKAFGNSRVTLYSDAFTGEVYLEYSNITKPLAQIGSKGSLLTLQTIQVSKDGKIGGTFQLFHHLMNYNPNTNQLEVKLTRDSSPYNMWINTKGELRGTYQFKVGNNISTGIMVDSKGNFTVPVNYAVNGTTLGSVWIGTNGQISGQIDLGKTIGNHSSLFVGFDKSGISSVGVPIGSFVGSPFSLSVGRDGGLSFGGFVPIAGIPVPIALGQDAHGNITLSWPGGHWSLGSESRPINAPAPKMKEDKSGYDGGQIWYHHSFKKGWKVVRVYNGPVKIDAKEQQSRAETIFKKYNEHLKRNPSISEFLNWYFYSGHELFDGGLVQQMNTGGEQKRNDLLAGLMTSRLSQANYTKVVPANAKFPNLAEYQWLQSGKKSEDFPQRPADLLSVNPFDSDVIAKAQTAANNPTTANVAQLTVGGSTTSMSQVTTAMTTSINQDSDYAKTMAKFKEYFNPTAATTSSSNGSGFIAAPAAISITDK